ncbi:VOC family protein [Fodinibius sp. Rm-B-1B1-1]|uniref:VOC family protein n=1 Tax=Fodinibius alkaliphilus TaxID=3140241 RepID=UPI003159F2BE
MEKVIGIGGIFFKSENPSELAAWYKKHLGLPIDESYGGYTFDWKDDNQRPSKGYSIWSPFPNDTDYIEPSEKDFMFNFIVDDLRALINQLKSEHVQISGEIEDTEFGLFGWIIDPEGNKVELWEPADDQ